MFTILFLQGQLEVSSITFVTSVPPKWALGFSIPNSWGYIIEDTGSSVCGENPADLDTFVSPPSCELSSPKLGLCLWSSRFPALIWNGMTRVCEWRSSWTFLNTRHAMIWTITVFGGTIRNGKADCGELLMAKTAMTVERFKTTTMLI